MGFSDLLLGGKDYDRQMIGDVLERIHANSVNMQDLIARLLDDSRLRAGRVEVHPRPLVLTEELARGVAQLGLLMDGHAVSVAVDPEVRVVADPNGLERIVGNLLSNAAKFSSPGDAIHIDARQMDGEVIVSVRDEGMGIAKEEQGRIFDRFYQAVRSQRGAGIGLSIVQRYVDMHGGRIWVESEPGRGSTFSFTLPAAATQTH
jgi:signal transduction histidine kinase